MFEDIWKGVQSLLDAYARIQPSDFVIVVFTSDAMHPAAWVSAALVARGVSFKRVWMLPLDDPGFEARLRESLPLPDQLQGRLVLLSFERDTMSHTTVLLQLMKRYAPEQVTALRAISAGAEFFSIGMLPAPEQIEARNAYLLERFLDAATLRITTPGGSDFAVGLDSSRHRWISNRGRLRPGGTTILPAGEVATYPVTVDGIFVADFAYNINTITDRDVRLNRAPVTLRLEGGSVTAVHCDDSATMCFLDQTLDRECTARVGELGFGTNIAVTEAIAMNSHVNERCPGVHLGLGQHNQERGVVDYQCIVHLDLIAQGGEVWVDGEWAVDLANIPASPNPHPSFTTDEDVFSPDDSDDCCGLVQCDPPADAGSPA